jgi:hypothetical protein
MIFIMSKDVSIDIFKDIFNNVSKDVSKNIPKNIQKGEIFFENDEIYYENGEMHNNNNAQYFIKSKISMHDNNSPIVQLVEWPSLNQEVVSLIPRSGKLKFFVIWIFEKENK